MGWNSQWSLSEFVITGFVVYDWCLPSPPPLPPPFPAPHPPNLAAIVCFILFVWGLFLSLFLALLHHLGWMLKLHQPHLQTHYVQIIQQVYWLFHLVLLLLCFGLCLDGRVRIIFLSFLPLWKVCTHYADTKICINKVGWSKSTWKRVHKLHRHKNSIILVREHFDIWIFILCKENEFARECHVKLFIHTIIFHLIKSELLLNELLPDLNFFGCSCSHVSHCFHLNQKSKLYK